MQKDVKTYVKTITKALKTHKTYSKGLDAQILSLATAMRSLDLANRDIDGLECTTVWEKTRYGEKIAPHPVFKIAKESQELITRQMKILGLTVEDLGGGDESDPLVDLTKKLANKRSTPGKTIYPSASVKK